MTVLQAVRAYPMASFWAVVMSSTIVSCLSPFPLNLSSDEESQLTPSSDYGVLRCLPHEQFRGPTFVPAAIWCTTTRLHNQRICHRTQVAVCASSVWAARCAYRRLHRWPPHQPYRIPLRDLDRPHAPKRLHLHLLLCQIDASFFRVPGSRGHSMGHLHCQRAGILQRDRTDKAASPCNPDAADVLGDWQYHRWCRLLRIPK